MSAPNDLFAEYTWKKPEKKRIANPLPTFSDPLSPSLEALTSLPDIPMSESAQKAISGFLGWKPITLSTATAKPSASNVQPTNVVTGKYNRGKMREEILNLFEKELGWKHDREFHLGEAIRKPGATYGVKNSHHYKGNAVDLTSRGTMSWEQMRRTLTGNANVRKFFADNLIGILDETTPEVMRKTNATGPHFHIGPDSGAVRVWNEWLAKYNV